MKITDVSYYVGSRFIPNIIQEAETGLIGETISNNDALLLTISEYEISFLSDAFGFYESKIILDQFEADGTVKVGADQKYKDLIDGDETIKWRGLRYEVAGVKQSMVADFVYAKYVRETETRLTQLGNTVDQAEKAQIVSSYTKYVQAFRRMYEQRESRDFHYWFFLSTDEKTLYDFISENEGFSTEYFKFYENVNSLGI
jgi:hypothetical protein